VLPQQILQDDEAQARRAEAIVREPFWIDLTVWSELGWVLFKRLKLDRASVGDALHALIDVETSCSSDPQGISWAIARFREGADWADMVHLVATRGAADRFTTFDEGVARQVGIASFVPVETLD